MDAGTVLGVIATLLAGGALYVSWYHPSRDTKDLKKGFQRLEADVDEQWERVQSHLGRISRLKREVMPSQPEAVVPDDTETILKRSDLYRRYRGTQPKQFGLSRRG